MLRAVRVLVALQNHVVAEHGLTKGSEKLSAATTEKHAAITTIDAVKNLLCVIILQGGAFSRLRF